MMSGRTCWVAAAALVAAGLQGCVMPQARPGKGDKLYDLTLLTLDGRRTSLLETTKGKIAVIKFGNTSCVWCTRQVPFLNQLAAHHARDPVAVIDINLGEPPEVAAAYARKSGLAYTMLVDPRGTAAAIYEISVIPVTIIARPDRTIVYRGEYTTFEQMERVVAPLLAGPKP